MLQFLLSSNYKKNLSPFRSQIFIEIMMYGFPIELQMQRTQKLHLLYIILTLYYSLSNCWERTEIDKHSKVTPDHQSKFS